MNALPAEATLAFLRPEKSRNRGIILAALPSGDSPGVTQRTLSVKTGLLQPVISRWVKHLIECREAYVCGWQDAVGSPAALYRAGSQANVEPPARSMSATERKRRFGESGEVSELAERRGQQEDDAARRRGRRFADEAAAGLMVDPLLAHFFGRVPPSDTAQS